MATTLHVYRSDSGWVVKRAGESRPARSFKTRGEAVATAVKSGKKSKSAQVVVYSISGRVSEQKSHGVQKIQNPPKRGRLGSKKIAAAVGKVVLNRVKASNDQGAEG